MKFQVMPPISAEQYFELLTGHGLVPRGFVEVELLKKIRKDAENSVFGLVVDETGVLASTLTKPISLNILAFLWIPEVKRLHTRKKDLQALGLRLREFWFQDGITRVEARSSTSRTQTIRTLKHIGFRQETTDHGLRSGVDYGNGPEGVVILGLLEGDAMRIEPRMMEEVAHGG